MGTGPKDDWCFRSRAAPDIEIRALIHVCWKPERKLTMLTDLRCLEMDDNTNIGFSCKGSVVLQVEMWARLRVGGEAELLDAVLKMGGCCRVWGWSFRTLRDIPFILPEEVLSWPELRSPINRLVFLFRCPWTPIFWQIKALADRRAMTLRHSLPQFKGAIRPQCALEMYTWQSKVWKADLN